MRYKTPIPKGLINEKFKYPQDFCYNASAFKMKDKHVFSTDARFTIFAMAAFGRFPFFRDSAGNFKYRLFSLPTLYTLLLYIFFVVSSFDIVCESLPKIFAKGRFDDTIASTRNMFLFINLFFLPVCHFTEWPAMTKSINEWDKFLVEFKQLTGKTIHLGFKTWANCLAILQPFGIITGTYIEKDSLIVKHWRHFMLYCSIFSGLSNCLLFFLIVQESIQHISDFLKEEIDRIAKKSRARSKITAYEVHKLKYIWAQTANLLDMSGSSMGLSILIVSLTNAGMILLSSYGLIGAIMNNDGLAAFHQLFNSIAGLIFLLVGCESSHRSSSKIKGTIIFSLSSIDMSGLSELVSRETKVFLHLVSLHPASVTCWGIITLSRSMITSVFSNVITYLIVLVQFKTADKSQPS